MARPRPAVQAYTADGPVLTAILDVLGDLYDLLDTRLPEASAEDAGSRVVPVSEPAPAGPPVPAAPVSEPAPDGPPAEQEPDDEPEAAEELPEPPPRAGRGSGLEAWQAWADLAGVTYPDGASRADIIAACEDAKVLPAE